MRICRQGHANKESLLSSPKSQRLLRFAIAMPIADPRNRAISETRDSNAALRFKCQGRKNSININFCLDFPRTSLTLTPGCPRVKKFLPTTGAAEKRTFWCGRPRFSARTSMAPKVCDEKSLAICDFGLRFVSPKPLLAAGFLAI